TFLKIRPDISKEEPSYDIQKYIEREVDMLKDARHPNVVQFMGCSLLNNEILLVTEFVCGGTVKEWIQDETRKMSDRLRVSIAMDVAKAMAYLHSRGIIHRDLKTDNLLVTENKRIKVCDFGFSRLAPTTAQEVRRLSFCGTDSYMAPEIILCTPFDHRIDVFSYGIILCELAMDKIAEGSVLSRTVPGFGIQQNEV
ncbi:kinase-like domain-containing protein, partial [Obelidium mucronatum]